MTSSQLNLHAGEPLALNGLSTSEKIQPSNAKLNGQDNSEIVHVNSQSTGSDFVPPHLSHDPENNLKRSDPFQFGSRLLSQEDNVFEFNAWDHVETDDTYKEYAELQYAKQREAPVSEFDKSMYSDFCLPYFALAS
jgi:hypothetical protein